MGSKEMPRRLSEREAAEFLGLRYQSLKNWRQENRSPSYFRIGAKIIYLESDLIEWMEARRITPGSVTAKQREVAS